MDHPPGQSDVDRAYPGVQSGPPITVFDGSTFTLQDLDGINGTNLVYDS